MSPMSPVISDSEVRRYPYASTLRHIDPYRGEVYHVGPLGQLDLNPHRNLESRCQCSVEYHVGSIAPSYSYSCSYCLNSSDFLGKLSAVPEKSGRRSSQNYPLSPALGLVSPSKMDTHHGFPLAALHWPTIPGENVSTNFRSTEEENAASHTPLIPQENQTSLVKPVGLNAHLTSLTDVPSAGSGYGKLKMNGVSRLRTKTQSRVKAKKMTVNSNVGKR